MRKKTITSTKKILTGNLDWVS